MDHINCSSFASFLQEDDIDLSFLGTGGNDFSFPSFLLDAMDKSSLIEPLDDPTTSSAPVAVEIDPFAGFVPNPNTHVPMVSHGNLSKFLDELAPRPVKNISPSPGNLFQSPPALAPLPPLPTLNSSSSYGPFAPTVTSCPPITQRTDNFSMNRASPVSKPASPLPMTMQTNGRLYEILEQNFINNPTPDQLKTADTRNLYLRWSYSPPERVHATSPSRLLTNPRAGAPFWCSVQLCAHCPSLSKYVAFPAPDNITLSASIYGKRKVKTGAAKTQCSEQFSRRNECIKLQNNPAGKPLLVRGESGTVEIILKKGESVAVFDSLSLTCGSNAARSPKALPAARNWDWDYHLLIKSNTESLCVHSLISKHLTTDSNRSQTREKRKLSELGEEESTPDSTPLKKQRVASPSERESSDVPSATSTPSPTYMDPLLNSVAETTPVSTKECNNLPFRPVQMKTFSNVISALKSDIFAVDGPIVM